jgi:uncharacterized protein
VIFDTGPLVAAANERDIDHATCANLLRTTQQIVVPGPVIAEAGFLISKHAGHEAEAAFLRSLTASRYEIVAPSRAELGRAAVLVARYADLPLGTTDAIVMAMVESRSDPRVATLDARHFSIVRPDGFERFVLLPDEAT